MASANSVEINKLELYRVKATAFDSADSRVVSVTQVSSRNRY